MIEYQFKSGDILAFSGASFQSDIINIGTYGIPRWSISHVGIVSTDFLRWSRKEIPHFHPTILFEAMPSGVQFRVNIKKIVNEYNGRVWVYPLYRRLYPHEVQRLADSLFDIEEIPYDKVGAGRSAGFLFATIQALFRGQDLSTFFCSELIANKLSEIGIHPVTNASKWNPNRLVRDLRNDRVVCKPIRLK